ncbi:MAG: hydrogenase iron-sulfur subunit [bacterium]
MTEPANNPVDSRSVDSRSGGAVTAVPALPVVVFHCDGGSLAMPAGEPEVDGAGFVRVSCAGRVSPGDLLRAVRAGAPGVLVAGCASGACRFHTGDERARLAAAVADATLTELGLGAGRVRFVPAGSGDARTAAVTEFVKELARNPAPGPDPERRRRMAALMDVDPAYPHHGCVQEAALLSRLPAETPVAPEWAEGEWAEGAEGADAAASASASASASARDLLYVCDLPVLQGLLGEHFPAPTHQTLRSCLRLLNRAGVPIRVAPTLPCCGHDFGFAGFEHRADEARRVLSALQATGAQRLVVVSPECEQHLRRELSAIGSSELELLGLVDLLAEHLRALGFTTTAAPPVALYVADAPAALRQSAERLLRGAGTPPVVVLPGEAPSGEEEGSAGVRGFFRCDGEARMAQERLLSAVGRAGASAVVTLSVIDSIHLGCATRRGGWRQTAVSVHTLFDWLAARLEAPGSV